MYIYSDNNISVDSTRYMVNGKTYPINNITSVEIATIEYPTKVVGRKYVSGKNEWAKHYEEISMTLGILLTVGAAYIYSEGFLDTLVSMFVAIFVGMIVAIPIGIFLIYLHKPSYTIPTYDSEPNDYAIRISTASGQIDSYKSKNKERIINIVRAINQAIVNRG